MIQIKQHYCSRHFPMPPTPLLDRQTIVRMYYKPPRRPPPGWTLRDQYDRAVPVPKTLYHWQSPQLSPSTFTSRRSRRQDPTDSAAAAAGKRLPSPTKVTAASVVDCDDTASRSRSHVSVSPHATGTPQAASVVVEQQPRLSLRHRIGRSVSAIGRRLNCFRSSASRRH